MKIQPVPLPALRGVASRALAVALSLALGCAPPPPPPAPGPVGDPRVHVEAVSFDEDVAPLLTPPDGDGIVDELLASPVTRDPAFRSEVERWIEYWSGPAARWVPDYVARMTAYAPRVDSALAAEGLPASLRYVPFIESGYSPVATSRASAVGMWQFMAGTARAHGMEVGPLVDQRRDPYRATGAAVTYLAELRERFGSWFLALAAYNGGPTRTRRILSRRAPLAEPSDSLFWALREHFPRETREFVPKLFGAMVVAGDPARFGVTGHAEAPSLAFEEVTVPDATTLDVVARAAGVGEDEIARLNPEVVRMVTPPGRRWVLRVPAGTAETFEREYALIPPEERVTFVEHTVASGETLSHIARRYRVTVGELRAANPEVRPRYLRIGARLTVPITTRVGGG